MQCVLYVSFWVQLCVYPVGALCPCIIWVLSDACWNNIVCLQSSAGHQEVCEWFQDACFMIVMDDKVNPLLLCDVHQRIVFRLHLVLLLNILMTYILVASLTWVPITCPILKIFAGSIVAAFAAIHTDDELFRLINANVSNMHLPHTWFDTVLNQV